MAGDASGFPSNHVTTQPPSRWGIALALVLMGFGPLGCSLKAIALRSTAELLQDGAVAFHEESDPAFAQETMGSQLKLVEALLQNDPANPRLLLLAAEGFNGYSFLFLEDPQPERAKGLYLRGREYALKTLARRPAFARLTELPLEGLEQALKKAEPADVAALFWAGFGWAGWINLSKDSAAAVAELPKAVLLMQRVRELDPGFHFGGPSMFFGVYYASRPAILGGDIRKAKADFQEARRLTSGHYLMTYVLEARYYAVAAQDQELFKSLLAKVREAPAGALPRARLADEVAKRKAAALLQQMEEFF